MRVAISTSTAILVLFILLEPRWIPYPGVGTITDNNDGF